MEIRNGIMFVFYSGLPQILSRILITSLRLKHDISELPIRGGTQMHCVNAATIDAFNESSEISRFQRSDGMEILNGIMFYSVLPHRVSL